MASSCVFYCPSIYNKYGRCIMLQEYFLIGEIAKPQGISGEIKVKPFTHDLANLSSIEVFYFQEGSQYVPASKAKVREYDGFIYIHFESVQTRNEAESLRGKKIYIRREQGAPLDEDENYIVDLIGCIGVFNTGEEVGQLVDVLQPGGLDIYVFKKDKATVMVPALKEAIPKVDIKERKIYLNKEKVGEVAVFDH